MFNKLKEKLGLKTYHWDGQYTITSKHLFIAIQKKDWYLIPTIHIDYRPWNKGSENHPTVIVFFHWLNILIRND